MPDKSSQAPLCIRDLRSGGLITNYVCSSACAHCVYKSSPKRDKAYIGADRAVSNFRRARELGCRGMHVGGGEPFLNREGLKAVLAAARQEGIRIDYVETNSSWFEDMAQATALLSELRKLGCGTLLISIDPFHNAYIPFARVKGAMAACRGSGMDVFPWLMDFFDEVNRFDDSRTHALAEYEKTYGPGYIQSLEHRYGVNMGGRALATFAPYHPPRPLAEILQEACSGCTVLGNTSHFHMDLYGDFIPTKCPGMAIAVEDLGVPLDPVRYPALTTLHRKGPMALYTLACDECGFAARETYVSPCELCYDVRKFLATKTQGRFPDLRPLEFYTLD